MGDSIDFEKIGYHISKIVVNLGQIQRKFNRNLEDYGRRIAIHKTFAYLLKPIFSNIIYYLYELDLSNTFKPQADLQFPNYTFKLLSSKDSDPILQIENMEEWLKGTLSEKLKNNNAFCLAIFDDEKVIGFNYAVVGEGSIPLLHLKVILGPTEAWSEQISISKDYRRKGLANILRHHFYTELKQRGITALYGHRQEFNTASRHSAKKFTSNIMAKVKYQKIVGFHHLIFYKSKGCADTGIKRMIIKPNAQCHIKQSSRKSPKFVLKIEKIK